MTEEQETVGQEANEQEASEQETNEQEANEQEADEQEANEQEIAEEEPQVYWATGKRKTSVASVRLTEGKGEIVVNKKALDEYFGAGTLPLIVKQPLEAVDRLAKYDIGVKVTGGGPSGQAGAVRHGISKALVAAEEDLRQQLKRLGFLTRDPRMKERKKYGRPGARARFQFSKR